METFIEIMFYSALVFSGVTAVAGALVWVGLQLAEEAVEDEDTH